MKRQRNAKIIATLGPASSSEERIMELCRAGVDVFRLNFSHGTHADQLARLETVRRVEASCGHPVGVLVDLQGPKLRLGLFGDGPIQVEKGDSFRLDLSTDPGTQERAPLLHPEIFAAIHPGVDLLVDDGRVRLRVKHCGADFAETEVIIGGKLSNNKGVNVPGVVLPLSPLTKKDRIDLEYAMGLEVDWIGMSFVQRPEDVEELRDLIGDRFSIMTKLEKPSAIEKLDEIVALSDAVMVARGDLGVELPPETIPRIQKRIIRACRDAGKPVVVATQMLESMISAPIPTRAEASDVATAIYDGADAVMLSGETAMGEYPLEAVEIMDRIVGEVEQDPHYRKLIDAEGATAVKTTAHAICAAVNTITHILPVAATVTYTSSGSTSLQAARERPEASILSLTANLNIARMLAVVWGVHSVQIDEIEDVDQVVSTACKIALQEGMVQSGQALVITAGMPFGRSGTTNLLRVVWVDEDGRPADFPPSYLAR